MALRSFLDVAGCTAVVTLLFVTVVSTVVVISVSNSNNWTHIIFQCYFSGVIVNFSSFLGFSLSLPVFSALYFRDTGSCVGSVAGLAGAR